MNDRVLYTVGNSKALSFAAAELEKYSFTLTDAPSPAVTHLLLPVPSSAVDSEELKTILNALPPNVTVLGGFLDQPELKNHKRLDLLKDELYLAKNAAITAQIAVTIAAGKLPIILENCPVLILGWGRIGKCLAALLKAMGTEVSVAARKETDRAMIAALGYTAEDIGTLSYILRRYRVIFNTAPCPVLSEEQLVHCRPDCLKIDLASKPGIAGNDVITARGLPGKFAPESSGKLIARTILRLCAQKEG